MFYLLGACLLVTLSGYIMLLWRLWLVDGILDTPYLVLFGGGALVFVGIGIRNLSYPMLWTAVALMGGGSFVYVVLEDYYEKTWSKRHAQTEIEKLQRRLRLNGADWRALRDLGEVYMRLEQFDDAVRCYEEAVDLHPPDMAKLQRALQEARASQQLGKMSQTRICRHCFHESPPGSKYCTHCKKRLDSSVQEVLESIGTDASIIIYAVIAVAAAAIWVLAFSPLAIDAKITIAAICVVICVTLLWNSMARSA